MGVHIGERAAAGVFLDGGGLYGTEDAVNFVVSQGEITQHDGPYAESKEVIGAVISTLRQISTGPDAPGD